MFLPRFRKFIEPKKESTKEVYEHTLNRIRAYIGDDALNALKFEDITLAGCMTSMLSWRRLFQVSANLNNAVKRIAELALSDYLTRTYFAEILLPKHQYQHLLRIPHPTTPILEKWPQDNHSLGTYWFQIAMELFIRINDESYINILINFAAHSEECKFFTDVRI